MNTFAKITAAAALALIAAPAIAAPAQFAGDNQFNPAYELINPSQGLDLSADVETTASIGSYTDTVVVNDQAFSINQERFSDFTNEGR